jgi:hypothetical protein
MILKVVKLRSISSRSRQVPPETGTGEYHGLLIFRIESERYAIQLNFSIVLNNKLHTVYRREIHMPDKSWVNEDFSSLIRIWLSA